MIKFFLTSISTFDAIAFVVLLLATIAAAWKAIDKINSLVENPYYYIFSDDPNEANKMAQTMAIKYKLIDHNKGKESYKDMFLMSQCKHNIIANSTFSWWGAWLNENEGKIVISPIYWDKNDLMFKPQPEDWISL